MDVERSLNQLSIFPGITQEIQVASALDYAVCRRIMRGASKNYSHASKYLPDRVRPHVEALYALMRIGDDRVDVTHAGFRTPGEAIDDWEATYLEAFETGYSPDPVMRAYLDTALRFHIPKDTMGPYFRAMRQDLTIKRFPAFEDLMHYMQGSAIPVGRAMTYILGVREPYLLEDALKGADALSVAMQLSNFWRDIGQDWTLGRVYIPLEDLDSLDYSEQDLEARRINSNLINLLEFQFERTEHFYNISQENVKLLATGRWAVMSALEIYRSILAGIRSNGYDVFTRKAGTTRIQKAKLALKSLFYTISL